MDIDTLSDEALMKRICARDVDAFRVLYARYETRIFNFTVRYAADRPLAEDLLQETFWRVWQAARTFDPDRGLFRQWLYRVALNTLRSELSRQRHARELPLAEPLRDSRRFAEQHTADDPLSDLHRKQTISGVEQALSRLSPVLREVVVLRCVEGLKFGEISARTGAPVGTLKARFHRAVADLRRRLSPGEP